MYKRYGSWSLDFILCGGVSLEPPSSVVLLHVVCRLKSFVTNLYLMERKREQSEKRGMRERHETFGLVTVQGKLPRIFAPTR